MAPEALAGPVPVHPLAARVLPTWDGPRAPSGDGGPLPPAEALERALSWTQENLPRFDPARQSRAAAAAAGMPGNALLELIIVCRRLYHSRLPPPLADRVARCLDAAAEAFLRGAFRHRMLRATPFFQYYAWLVACLSDTGRLPDPQAELAALQRLVDRGHADLHNRTHPPHGVLELRYVLDLAGVDHRLPGYRDLYDADVLAAPIDPFYVTEMEGYAVTHVVYYLSDMGLRPVHSLDRRRHATCTRAVATLMEHYLCLGNWDLVAELLLCRAPLALPHTRREEYALECLLSAQHADGSIPGPHFDPRILAALPEDRAAQYAFHRTYHTTLVTAMALAGHLFGTGPHPAPHPAAPAAPTAPVRNEVRR